MSFKTKTDYFGLSSISGLKIVASSENKSASTAEAKDENGFVVATHMYGVKSSPACDYVITSDVTMTDIILGSVVSADGHNYCLGEITINTAAGTAPTLAASGSQIEDGTATDSCTAEMPTVQVNGLHHAQTFGAFTLSGTGAHLTQCTFAATTTVSTADKDGEPLAHDIVDGRCTVNGTIQVSDSAYGIPTVTPASGWVMSAPLTETNPDSDFPTYTFTLTKYLTCVEPA